jgi:hypothetical protein
MESMRPAIPATVPAQAAGGANADVSATTITGQSALDTQPDARTSTPKSAGDAAQTAPGQQDQQQAQSQTQNQQPAGKKSNNKKKSKAKKDNTSSKKKSTKDQT